MEIIKNRSVQELVSIINDARDELDVLIEEIFNETIQKMRGTDEIELRKDLFYQLLNETVKFNPDFDIDNIQVLIRNPEISTYYFQKMVSMNVYLAIDFRLVEIVLDNHNLELNYDNFCEIMFG